MIGLTHKQALAKRYIAEQNSMGISPTCRDISRAIGSPNASNGFYVLQKLMERGHAMRFLTPDEAAAGRPGHIIAIGS